MFFMFIPPPLKIPNLCSSDICGRINNVILRTVNPCSSVSIRVPKTFVLFVRFVFKKAVRPSPTHQCRTQADHFYLICHARRLPFPSPDTTITSSHHFTTFLPFTIYIP